MSSRAATLLRGLFRFRLRTLLLAVLVISVGMGIYVHRAKRQQASVAAVKSFGGDAFYDYQVQRALRDPISQSWAPQWLRNRLGDDFFHTVVQVRLFPAGDSGRFVKADVFDRTLSHIEGFPKLSYLEMGRASDDGLAHIGKLRHLQGLAVWEGAEVTDAGAAHLLGCRELERLYVRRSQISDEGLRVLSQLPRLKTLYLPGNRCTDAGLVPVGRMRQLTLLSIGGSEGWESRITDSGLIHLAELPQIVELGLEKTKVTSDGLMQLKGLKTLKRLLLDETKVMEAPQFQAALPDCSIAYPRTRVISSKR